MTNRSEFDSPVVQADDMSAAYAAGELHTALKRLAVLNMHPAQNAREIAFLRTECSELLGHIHGQLLA